MNTETQEDREAWIMKNHAEYMRAALTDIAKGQENGKPMAAADARDRARRCLKSIGLRWPHIERGRT